MGTEVATSLSRFRRRPGLPAAAAHRLGLLALIYAIIYGILTFAIPKPEAWIESGVIPYWYAAAAVFIVLSLAFFFAVKRGKIPSHKINRAGVAFELFGAVGIEIGLLWWNGEPNLIELGLSWTAAWIIMFPFLMPYTPR